MTNYENVKTPRIAFTEMRVKSVKYDALDSIVAEIENNIWSKKSYLDDLKREYAERYAEQEQTLGDEFDCECDWRLEDKYRSIARTEWEIAALEQARKAMEKLVF